MSWLQKGANHYHTQLVHPEKGHVIKGPVVCYVEWLGSMNEMGLSTSLERGSGPLLWLGWISS